MLPENIRISHQEIQVEVLYIVISEDGNNDDEGKKHKCRSVMRWISQLSFKIITFK